MSIKEQYESLDLTVLPSEVLAEVNEIKEDSEDFTLIPDFIEEDWNLLWDKVIKAKYSKAIKEKSKIKQIVDDSEGRINIVKPKQNTSDKPKNLAQLKKWLKENKGNKVWLVAKDEVRGVKKPDRIEEREIAKVQSNSVSFLRNVNGEIRESWLDYGASSDWTFTDEYFKNESKGTSFKTELYYYYNKVEPKNNEPEPLKLSDIPAIVKKFMPTHQQKAIVGSVEHWGILEGLEKQLKSIPKLYKQDGMGKKAIVYAHYFVGETDVFVTEFDGDDDAFGYTILNGDDEMAEFGYIVLSDLKETGSGMNAIQLDFFWKEKTLEEALYDVNPKFYPKPGKKEKPSPKKPVTKKSANTFKKKTTPPSKIIKEQKGNTKAVSEEAKLFRRFVNLVGKEKSVEKHIVPLIKALQRAFVEGKIKKNSPFTDDFMEIQRKLVKINNDYEGETIVIKVPEEEVEKYKKIINGEVLFNSVKWIKYYVSRLAEKNVTKDLAERALKYFEKNPLTKQDPFQKWAKMVKSEVENLVKKPGEAPLEEATLNGLNGVIEYCDCNLGKIPLNFNKALETKDFVYYVDFQEGDMDGSTIMLRKKDKKIVGNNYHASQALQDDIEEGNYTWASKQMKENIALMLEGVKGLSGFVGNMEEAKEQLPEKIDIFTRSDQKPENLKEVFTLPGEAGKFLQQLQPYKLAILITGDTHGGKSELVKKITNAFLSIGKTVGDFDLEQGGLASKDTQGSIERNIERKNRHNYFVTGEAPNGWQTIKDYADRFDVVVIDSFQKLDVPGSYFDQLRNEYPDTIFIVIFQQTVTGTTKGGAAPDYDAPVAIKVHKVDSTFKNNYAELKKNRGNRLDLVFNISEGKTYTTEEYNNKLNHQP